MNGQPDFTPLAEGAQQMHELYRSWIDAGFTRDEALQLLALVIVAQQQVGQPTAGDAR